MRFRKIWRKDLKRGRSMRKGLVESPYLVKLEDDIPSKPWRRVYEDWNLAKPSNTGRSKYVVPWVVVIGDARIVTLTADQRKQLEAYVEDDDY